MKKLFLFTLRLALLVAFAAYLADRPGSVQIVWHDYIIDTSASVLGLVVLGFGLIIYCVFRIGYLLKYGPGLWRINRHLRKIREGQKHLDQGMIAIASGYAAEAGKLAVTARKKLGTTISTQLLQAQAAQLAGDHSAAREIFHALANNSDSIVMGYRGLIMDARRRKDWEGVERLVEQLNQLKPKTPWVNIIRFDLLVRRQNWEQANLALMNIASAQLLSPKDLKSSRAAILVALSQEEAAKGHHDSALQLAEQASKQTQDWLPAIINLAQRQLSSGNKRIAYRTITKYWSSSPHPDLAALYHQGESNPLDAYKQLQRLCKKPDPINQFVMAEAALAANIWGEARRHLIDIISKNNATQSVYRLLARLERRETGDEAAVQQWLNRAFDAVPDPVWVCHLCGGSHQQWQATCAHCGQFNTLDWQNPGQSHKPNSLSLIPSYNWID